jgi:hypothetical protein
LISLPGLVYKTETVWTKIDSLAGGIG